MSAYIVRKYLTLSNALIFIMKHHGARIANIQPAMDIFITATISGVLLMGFIVMLRERGYVFDLRRQRTRGIVSGRRHDDLPAQSR